MLPRMVVFLVFAGAAFGQDATATALSTPDSYELFFQRVVSASRSEAPVSDQVLINGERVAATRVSAREVLGLTDAEMAKLTEIASECTGRLASIRQAGAGLTMAARLERIAREIGEPDGTTQAEQRLAELEIQRREAIAEDMQKLKDSFGEDRFQALDDQVRSGKNPAALLDVPKAKK